MVWKIKHEPRKGGLFADYVLEISEFRAQTLATDPEDFQNFETFSLAMIDLDYNRDVFRLSRVFWGEEVIKAAGGLEKADYWSCASRRGIYRERDDDCPL